MVEGCIGAGKTTVARGLAEYRKSQLILENFESNPFLGAFYKDPTGTALETEFAFLLLHYHQLKGQADAISSQEFIADFHLGKDLLYADLNLRDSRAHRLFGDLYEICVAKTPDLNLLVFLSASTDTILDRIRLRRRDFELEIDPQYYDELNKAYEKFFTAYSGRKLRVAMDEWDFVKEPALFERVSLLVDHELNTK